MRTTSINGRPGFDTAKYEHIKEWYAELIFEVIKDG